jgi:hypothetical protein
MGRKVSLARALIRAGIKGAVLARGAVYAKSRVRLTCRFEAPAGNGGLKALRQLKSLEGDIDLTGRSVINQFRRFDFAAILEEQQTCLR